MIKKVSLFALLLSLTGCVNPYEKFYVAQNPGLGTSYSNENIGIPPKLIHGSNPDADFQEMLEEGYDVIGYSSFNAASVSADDALEQATAVHADVVIYYSRYTHTVSGSVPLTVPNTQTSNTNIYGNSYGSGGYRSFSGSANTTTYGTQTTYMPYNVNRFDYYASYWIKTKPGILGVRIRDMTDEQRKEVGGNKGVAIIAVVKGSVAYRSDFLKGDILEKIGDTDLYEVKDLLEIVHKYQGQSVNIQLIRDGKALTKTVQLGEKL